MLLDRMYFGTMQVLLHFYPCHVNTKSHSIGKNKVLWKSIGASRVL
jgi:hypothetical protein